MPAKQELSPEEVIIKKKIIFAILFGIGLTQSMMLMIVSFMPLYIKEHYDALPTVLVGLIVRYKIYSLNLLFK
jgi:hypothetical protein